MSNEQIQQTFNEAILKTVSLDYGCEWGGVKDLQYIQLNDLLTLKSAIELAISSKTTGEVIENKPLTYSDKLKDLHSKLKPFIDECKELGNWDLNWAQYWKTYGEHELKISYCDPDTTYEEDMMALFNAIERELKSYE